MDGGKQALEAFREVVMVPKMILADQTYTAVVDWALMTWLWDVQNEKCPRGRIEFQLKRWIVP